jgi:hypothetical protein
MADLTLGPNFPAEGTLDLTTTWKSIELVGEPSHLFATDPVANMVYGVDPDASARLENPISTSLGPQSLWTRPYNMQGARRKVWVKLTSSSSSGVKFQAR